jgi:NAD(P)H-dependent flavin oxidoreductase YrpB (nitropropane dioxygenase family)
MAHFAQWCGWTLALSHARSGDPAVISGYLGKSDAFDKAIAAFSVAYADQNEKDHAVLQRAIRDGKIEAVIEEPK